MSRIILSLLGIFIVYSCGSASQPNESAISGTISEATEGNQLILEQITSKGLTNVDTAVLDAEGKFAFDYEITEAGFYRIRQDEQQFITLILRPGEQAVLQATWNIGQHPYTITGSPESEVLKQVNNQMTMLYRVRDSLNSVYQANSSDEQVTREIQEYFAAKMQENATFVREFIKENSGSLASLAAAEQLNPEADMEYYRMVDEGLAKTYPNSPYYQEFHKNIAKMQNLAIGTVAPDIVLPNTKGETVSLSDFRGKVVLVDFWASWCRPCRMENPNIVRAYKQFNDKGFEVFGVSLDKEKQSWISAIEQDQLHWTQVSDLMFWSSPVVKLYDISGIPFAVLIDEEGRIIAKNLRGQALIDKLNEVLNP